MDFLEEEFGREWVEKRKRAHRDKLLSIYYLTIISSGTIFVGLYILYPGLYIETLEVVKNFLNM